MAAKKTSRTRAADQQEPSLQSQAEQLQQKLGESAQQIWLAGLGAFGRAQQEGGKLFDTLVREGSRFEQRAGEGATRMRDAVGAGLDGARTRAGATFERVDQEFRDRVGHALKALEVPTRRELGALIDRVDALNAHLRRHNGVETAPETQAEPTPPPRRRRAPRKPAAGAASSRTRPAGPDAADAPPIDPV